MAPFLQRSLNRFIAAFGSPFCAGMVALGGALGLSLNGVTQDGWSAVPVDVELVFASEPSQNGEALAVVDLLLKEHGHLNREDRRRVARAVVEEAKFADFDPLLVLAVIRVESEDEQGAISNVGARGLMQLRQPTAQYLSEREQLGLSAGTQSMDDPALNVRLGVRYLSRLHRAFGNLGLALVAYNAGPHRVSELVRGGHGIPDRFQSYPRKIDSAYRKLLRESGSDSGALAGSDAFWVKVARR
jgi:soluble lytic murein transglycosylase